MKKKIYTNIFISTLIGSVLLIGSGCSQKSILPPASGSSQNQSDMYDGPSIPPSEGGSSSSSGYSEDNLSLEGTLDDNSHAGFNGNDEIEKSPEYLIAHGRSSIEFKPVYFSFDQTLIQPSMQQVIVGNAQYLKDNPTVSVAIEGNTDERGTNEYNMALGERRALNVEKYLISLGIEKNRVRTVSLGEERPIFHEQNENAYYYNRRADFRVD